MFEDIKKDILGKNYSLSIAFVDPEKSQEINKKYRKKDKPTNVLAFPLAEDEGEILLCKQVIRKEAKNFDKTYEEFLVYLVIHGMLHLKGMDHGSIMEKAEKSFLAKYDKKYRSSNRRGHSDDSSSRRRISKRRKKS